MDLLLLNSLKGLKKKKIQMFGIIIMVLLSTAIYTAMNSGMDRIENRYYNYLDENKVEHVSLDVKIDYKKDLTIDKLLELEDEKLKDLDENENQVLQAYKLCLTKDLGCSDMLYLGVEQLFKKYGLYEIISEEKLRPLSEKYDFTYELQKNKVITNQNYTTNVMPYNPHKKINLPHLIEGKFPEKASEITVLPGFAKTNNLKIGDNYKINGKQYKIVGLAYASDYIYPMLSMNQPIFDEKYNNIVMMLNSDYELIDGVNNDSYGFLLNGNYERKNRLIVNFGPADKTGSDKKEEKKTIDEIKKSGNSIDMINLMLEEENDKLTMGMNSIVRIMRTDMIQMEFNGNRTFAEAFLYLLLGIAVFIIIVITKKRIDDERLQIGVLKSLGYKRYQIALSYLVYPIVGSIIGGILGYFIGVLIHEPITYIFKSFYNIPLSGFKINSKYFINSLMIPLILLSVLSFIIAYFMLRKKPLELLKEGSNLKINRLSKLMNNLTKRLSFETRFRYQLASRSFGKLLIVTLTSFCTGLLIVLILIGSNLFNYMIDKSFEVMKFKYMVSYNTPQFDTNTTDDLILSTSMDLEKIMDNKGREKKLNDENYEINLTGIDSYLKYNEVKDDKDKNLIPKLFEEENSIIINKNISEYMNVKTGDTLILDFNNQDIKYKVVGITDEYMNATGYVNREDLSKIFNYENAAYTMKYSNDSKYKDMNNLSEEEMENIAGIFSIDELRSNIEKQLSRMDAAIYIVIFFASFMVLIIISVIANIVVEENKKTISLMKVMGYKNKEISQIVLNIYTPFIIIAYILSIPCMISILKWIISLLVGDTKMIIPVTISPVMAVVGLIGLLIAYYIAIGMSKKVLNKVPLAVALKRE